MASTKNVVVLASMVFLAKTAANELARGWGSDINWMNLETALQKSKEEKKPVMLVIHKTYCGACKALKPKFAADNEIQKLSSKFLMVNAEDDEEPKDAKYRPDGGYIPRIFFMTPDGKVLSDVYNKNGNPKYKYYYSNAAAVVTSMKNALKQLERVPVKKEL